MTLSVSRVKCECLRFLNYNKEMLGDNRGGVESLV